MCWRIRKDELNGSENGRFWDWRKGPIRRRSPSCECASDFCNNLRTTRQTALEGEDEPKSRGDRQGIAKLKASALNLLLFAEGRVKHASATLGLSRRHLFLCNIPMLNQLSIFHTEDVHDDEWFGVPTRDSGMDHDDVTLRSHHPWLVLKICGQLFNHVTQRVFPIRKIAIMLHIGCAPVPFNSAGIPVDEEFRHCS